MTRREREQLSCAYCDGLGEIETDNNGPIVACPACREWPADVRDTQTPKGQPEPIRQGTK